VYNIVSFELRPFPVWILEDPRKNDLLDRIRQSDGAGRVETRPGDPENNARAGTTVFGGTMVLSAIFAQSLMIVNFPLRVFLEYLV
jgi:hypothetical protein